MEVPTTLIAAPESLPAFLVPGDLHAALHGLGSPGALYLLGGLFLLLAAAESIADKIGFIEKWLVPISTTWRPFYLALWVEIEMSLRWRALPAASA